MAKTHSYRARLRWTGSVHGPTSSYEGYSREYAVDVEGKPVLAGSADPLFRGDPALHNPEDLLLAALSACHMLSYLALAARARIEILAYEDAAEGTMEFRGGGGAFTRVVLHPKVTVAPGADTEKAAALHETAHKICFIAASVNFPVEHEAVVEQAPAQFV
jgi:organic hydroperoxide reductase OsmC/OhrA